MSVQIIEKKKAHVPESGKNLPMKYAEAASVPCEGVELSLKEFQQHYWQLKEMSGFGFISSLK